jgi:hypothetical protein
MSSQFAVICSSWTASKNDSCCPSIATGYCQVATAVVLSVSVIEEDPSLPLKTETHPPPFTTLSAHIISESKETWEQMKDRDRTITRRLRWAASRMWAVGPSWKKQYNGCRRIGLKELTTRLNMNMLWSDVGGCDLGRYAELSQL